RLRFRLGSHLVAASCCTIKENVLSRPYFLWHEERMSISTPPGRDPSFAETALRLGGKTDEEARRTGAVDKADEQVEALFAPQYQTVNSPVHKGVWDGQVPLVLFAPPPLPPSAPCDVAMQKSIEIVKRRRESGSLYNEQ